MDFFQITWRKARRSANNGACVEIGSWRKSSHSGAEGHCVEVAADAAVVVLARDSKDPDGPTLGFGADAWTAFLKTVKTGHLDHPRARGQGRGLEPN